MAKLGTVVMSGKAFQEIVNEVRDEALGYRQLAYDAAIEMLSLPVPAQDLDDLIRQMTDEGLAGLQSEYPAAATDVLRRSADVMERGGIDGN